jgi:hypothetical protein
MFEGRKIEMEDFLTCINCGQQFTKDELTMIQYREYEGACLQKDLVSPCCHAAYN